MQKTIAELATSGCAVLVFLLGVLQYRAARVWKRSEFAIALLAAFANDPDVAFCRTLMDWSPRRVEAPKRYFTILESDHKSHIFVHSWDGLWEALSKKQGFDWNEVVYRDCFDVFFTYFEQLDRCFEIGLVSSDDLRGLTYWLNKIATLRVRGSGPLVFRAFVEDYYPSTIRLMNRYKIAWPSNMSDHGRHNAGTE